MANEEHLKILRQGAEVWNNWRDQSKIEPDLSDADLSHIRLLWETIDLRGMNLRNVNFRFASFREPYFSGSNLHGADFFMANLVGAHFDDANLTDAGLSGANLNSANFTGANLSTSQLIFTNLSNAILNSVNFTGAELGATIFGNNDLSEVKGLDSVTHLGPSIISIDTLYKSGGNIPVSFLRGCGVPDEFIAYLHSILGARRATQPSSIHVSSATAIRMRNFVGVCILECGMSDCACGLRRRM